MTLREEVLKNSGINSSDFQKRLKGFEKEFNNIKSKYNIYVGFGWIDSGDDDQIIIGDINNDKMATYLDTDLINPPKMTKEEKVEYQKFLKRVDVFIKELRRIENKYNINLGYGYVDPGDDDDFIGYDKKDQYTRDYIDY